MELDYTSRSRNAMNRRLVASTIGVVGAYRYIDMDYESDDGGRDFKYDMSMSGPALGVVFTF